MRDELPKTWAVAQLDELLSPLDDGRKLHHGWSPLCEKEASNSELEWAVLKTTAVQAGLFLPEHNKRLPLALRPRPQHEVKVGDLLITCAGPRVRCGVPCLVRTTRPRLMLSGKMYRFRVAEDRCDPRYLENYLLSQAAQSAIDAMKTGGNDSGLNLTHDRFKPLPVPVAPLPEQQRIVSRIEELFSEIDAGECALERVRKLVERYRQSVLKAAVTGELTREWRGCDASRPEAYEGDGIALPAGWSWRSLDELSRSTSYGTSAKCSSAEGAIPVLRIPNVRHGRIDLGDLKWAPAGFGINETDALAPGDLLVVRTNGSESLIGVGAVVLGPLPTPSYFASYLIRFRLRPEPLLADWINLVWQSDLVRRFVHKHKATSAGQYNVSQSKLRSIQLPIPPEKERAALLDAWRIAASRMESTLKECNSGIAGSTALRQSILKAAFSGHLVPQDHRAEPASALLARLAAQAGDTPPAARRRGRPARHAVSHPNPEAAN